MLKFPKNILFLSMPVSKRLYCIFLFFIFYFNVYPNQGYFGKELNDSIKLKNVLDSIYKYQNNDYNKAYNFASEGLKYKPGNIIDKISLLQIMAYIEYYYMNDFDNSTAHLNEMRYLSDSIGFKRGIPWADLNLANVYYYQKDFEKFIELNYKAIENAKIIGDSLIIVNALIGIADSYLHYKEDYDSALILINQVLDYVTRNNRQNEMFLLYDDIANIYKRTGKYDSSYYYYEKTLDVSKKNNNKFGVLCSKTNLAYVSYLKDKSFEATPILEKLQKECEKEGFLRLYYEIGYTICEILEYQGLYKQSLELYKRTRELEDSITANENIRKSTEIESNYILQIKESENEELTKTNEINTLKLRNRQYLMFFVLFILLQAIGLLYIIYRKYLTIKHQEQMIFEQEKQILQNEKEAMEQKIKIQEREMTGKIMKIYHHNQLIQKVILDIRNIKRMLKTEEVDKKNVSKKLQSIANQLNISSNKQMWTEFEKSFVESNPNYLKKLSAKYPGLTPNETKLCIFLFLNLRTKDISIITQQSIKSINVARTRLRKKLQIDNTKTNLSAFLRNI